MCVPGAWKLWQTSPLTPTQSPSPAGIPSLLPDLGFGQDRRSTKRVCMPVKAKCPWGSDGAGRGDREPSLNHGG